MRHKPGHRTALGLGWRNKMPRSGRRNRKICLCWKAFMLTRPPKDIKKNPSVISARPSESAGRGGQGEGEGRRMVGLGCPLSSCGLNRHSFSLATGWLASLGLLALLPESGIKAPSQLGKFPYSVRGYSFLGSLCQHFTCTAFVFYSPPFV